MFGRIAVLLSAVVMAVGLATYLLMDTPSAEAATCSGKDVYPSQDIVKVAASSPKGTTFCVHDGTYNISRPIDLSDGDTFIGVYSDSTRPVISTARSPQVINAGPSDWATIQGLTITGAVGGNYCEPACGQGIRGGEELTVVNSRITGNQNNGIGGVGPGLLVKNSIIDRNGSRSFTSLDGGVSSSAGIKSMEPMTVIDSRISDNYWNGVWCDGQCGALSVKNNVISGNGKAGVHDEISTGPAVITGNTIQRNGILDDANFHAGILIANSTNVKVSGNTFGQNVSHGVQVFNNKSRSPKPKKVKVRDNNMKGNAVTGCSFSGVSCSGNR